MDFALSRGDGKPIHPGEASVPILKELERGKLSVIGTGFYITRYGLFLTAKHVLEDILDADRRPAHRCFVLHLAGTDGIHLRRVLSMTPLEQVDLAVGQADNYMAKYPGNPLMNLRGTISRTTPARESELVTYAYPENMTLDFTEKEHPRIIKGDYDSGKFLELIGDGQNPFIPYPHFQTTIDIRSGASGGPVFDMEGNIVGMNCRGWDFRGAEFEQDPLSSVVPAASAMPMIFALSALQIPVGSWEWNQVPESARKGNASFADLIKYGHILCKEPDGSVSSCL